MFYNFLKFWLYFITNNKKKYDTVKDTEYKFFILCMNLAISVFAMITITVITSNILGVLIPVLIILIATSIVESTYREGEWFRAERERAERERAERQRKKMEEDDEDIFRFYKEYLRRAEEIRRKQEFEKREQYRSFYGNYYYDRNNSYRSHREYSSNSQSFSQHINDKNMANAIKLLGLKEGFTKHDVKKAYRNLSKTHHPDSGGLESNFIRLNKAYEYIMERI